MIDYTEQIKKIISECSDLSEEQMSSISADTNISELGLDSLDLVEAVIAVEREFDCYIEISGNWMEDAQITINSLNKILNEKLHG